MRALTSLLLVAVLTGLTGLTGCTDDAEPEGDAGTPSETTTPTPPPTATPAPTPDEDACYDLGFEEAVSPTSEADPIRCRGPHSSETFEVGQVDNLVDGHLLAVDSAQVQDRVAEVCPAAFGDTVGGSVEDRRLSMLRAVWFTPSLEQSALGASWYRCDVVALAGAEALTTVRGSLAGVLDTPEGRDRYGMCGTAGPDEPGFERVPCGEQHSWRAFSVIDLPDGDYPGRQAVAEAGAGPCEDAAAGVAEDALDYEWGYEGPDAEQWATGQTFIRCWAPDGG